MTHPYKAVFFDLDDTLLLRTPTPAGAFVIFARSMNIHVDWATERRVKLWTHRYWGEDKQIREDKSRFHTDTDFWLNYNKQLLEVVEVTTNLSQQARLSLNWFDEHYDPHVEIAPGSYKVLATLKEAGYRLGLISNRPDPVDETVTKLGLEGIFDIMVAAGEVGYWKPDPAIFAYALSQLNGIQAEDCVYIGDNYFSDGQGAARAGWVPILFDPEGLYENIPYHRIKRIDELLEKLV